MIEIPSLRPESRYGMPPADLLLFNREYVVGYSYLFRQPRWAMEVVDPTNRRVEVKRDDTFRADLRVPDAFRAGLEDYRQSGYDRGHLVASADRRSTGLKNSETFLMTNMSPQVPRFNRGIWKRLEKAVRDLASMFEEVYVVCGPLFDVGKTIRVIGDDPDNPEDVVVPVPDSYFKSVLAENVKGTLELWSFILPNATSSEPLKRFLCQTTEIERRAGLLLWDRLRGERAERLKGETNAMWSERRARASAAGRGRKTTRARKTAKRAQRKTAKRGRTG